MAYHLFASGEEHEGEASAAGKLATVGWLGCALWLYLVSPGAPLLSLTALAFFVAGMFMSAFVFGIAIYFTRRISIGLALQARERRSWFKLMAATVIRWAWLPVIFITARAVFGLVEGR
jgi:Na+/proline symporter